MDNYTQLGLAIIIAIILFGVVLSGWQIKQRRRYKESTAAQNDAEEAQFTLSSPNEELPLEKDDFVPESKMPMGLHLLVLSVMAKPGNCFSSYDLLQVISAANLHFGAMNIFHYYETTGKGRQTLFSLVSANEPGEFNLDRMGEFSCNGLMLFMDIATVPDPKHAFKLMLQTAEQLTEDLDAKLCALPGVAWNAQTAREYHNKIMQLTQHLQHETVS